MFHEVDGTPQTCNLGIVKYTSPPDSLLNFWNSYKLALSSSHTINKCSYRIAGKRTKE